MPDWPCTTTDTEGCTAPGAGGSAASPAGTQAAAALHRLRRAAARSSAPLSTLWSWSTHVTCAGKAFVAHITAAGCSCRQDVLHTWCCTTSPCSADATAGSSGQGMRQDQSPSHWVHCVQQSHASCQRQCVRAPACAPGAADTRQLQRSVDAPGLRGQLLCLGGAPLPPAPALHKAVTDGCIHVLLMAFECNGSPRPPAGSQQCTWSASGAPLPGWCITAASICAVPV